jgi:hypothetical protein
LNKLEPSSILGGGAQAEVFDIRAVVESQSLSGAKFFVCR